MWSKLITVLMLKRKMMEVILMAHSNLERLLSELA